MIYLIPGWQDDQVNFDFDENIHHDQLFFNFSSEQSTLLNLSYSSKSNKIAQKWDLNGMPYKNMFDFFQKAEDFPNKTFDINDLNWPSDYYFLRADYSMLVFDKNNVTKAKVGLDLEFSSMNDITVFDYEFSNGEPGEIKYILDDRGFISLKKYFKKVDGERVLVRNEYLSPAGTPEIIEDVSTGKVILQKEFSGKTEFDNMNELRKSYLNSFIEESSIDSNFLISLKESNFITASDISVDKRDNVYFLVQNSILDKKELINFINNQKYNFEKYIFSDSIFFNEIKRIVNKRTDEKESNRNVISPYSSNWILENKGLQVREFVIFWIVSMDSTIDNKEIFHNLSQLAENNSNIRIIIFDPSMSVRTEQQQITPITSIKFTEELSKSTKKYRLIKNRDKGKKEDKVIFTYLSTEINYSDVLKYARLVIDTSKYPNEFLSILSLSKRIPELQTSKSDLLTFEKMNLVSTLDELMKNINSYKNSLNLWSEAKQEAFTKSQQFTNGKLIQKWFDVLNLGKVEIDKSRNYKIEDEADKELIKKNEIRNKK